MGRMTREQWNDTAEKAAAENYGREHSTWYTVRHFAPAIAVTTAVLALVCGAVWLIRKTGQVLSTAHAPQAGNAVPMWVWIAMAVAALASFLLLRPGYIPSHPGVLIAKVLGVALAWLALIGLALGYGIG